MDTARRPPAAPLSAAATARRVAEMEAHFEQQLEMIEHRAQMAIATARLEAAAEADKAAQRKLQEQSDEFRAELAELESQAEHALERSATAEQDAESNSELATRCDAQADTIQRLTTELAEVTAARANDRHVHAEVLAAKEAEWSDMERDFIVKTMALEDAHRRRTKAEQRLAEAHIELEAMDESLRKLSEANEYDNGLFDDRLRARLQARIVAMGNVQAQLLVDGQIWASAYFSAATDIDSGFDAASQRAMDTVLTHTGTLELKSTSATPSQRRRSSSTSTSAHNFSLDLEHNEATEQSTHLLKKIKNLRRQVTECGHELQRAVAERDDAVRAKIETQSHAELWIRKIQDARTKERSAHERELMECDARREAAESKLHALSLQCKHHGHRYRRWSGDGDGGAGLDTVVGAGWVEGLSVNSASSAPTHLAGKALQQAVSNAGASTRAARQSAAPVDSQAKHDNDPSSDDFQLQRGGQHMKMAADSRGADQVVRAARGSDSRSGKRASAPVAAGRSTAMPGWHALVMEQTKKLHADKPGRASGSNFRRLARAHGTNHSAGLEMDTKSDPEVAMGSASVERVSDGECDRSSISSSSRSSSSTTTTSTSSSNNVGRGLAVPAPGANGKGRWAARAAAAARRRP